MTRPRILVCGGRDFSNGKFLFWFMDNLCEERGWVTEKYPDGSRLPAVDVIHGGARGADDLAGVWAIAASIEPTVYKADWKRYGKKAGPIRNAQMLAEGRPDIVVAFPGGTGTAHMVQLAKEAGLEVVEITNGNGGD